MLGLLEKEDVDIMPETNDLKKRKFLALVTRLRSA
jgi:hypothetical protein